MENQTSQPETPAQTHDMSQMGTPVAIVIAGALVAAALYFGGGAGVGTTAQKQPTQPTIKKADVVAVTASDHIIGDPNAPIKIIEYTDFECPFCKQFHGTMTQIMATYGKEGKVAWVIRNFPLEQLHPNAPKLAHAAECVAEQGGSAAYIAFLDEVFRVAPINTFFDFTKLDATVKKSMAAYPAHCEVTGVDLATFKTCNASGKFEAKISQETQDAIASGGQGTPHNILIDKKGNPTLIAGAQPLEVVKAAIDKALK